MRKFMLFAAILAGIANPAFATEGIRVAPGVRAGTSCSLSVNGMDTYNGLCNVVTHGSNTVVNTGAESYVIRRDYYGSLSGEFVDSSGLNYGRINANVNCWRGRHVSFCAQ